MIKTEQLVLCGMIMSQKAFDYVIDHGLQPTMFLDPIAQDIAQQIIDYRTDNSINVMPIIEIKADITPAELASILDTEPYESVHHMSSYFKELFANFIQTQVTAMIQTIDYTPEGIHKLADDLVILTDTHKKQTMIELARTTIEDVRARQHPDYINEFKTKLYDYDRLGHYERGHLVIIGGKSGMGKTRFALNLTHKWLQNGLRVVYISYEMTARACLLSLGLIREHLSWDAALRQKDAFLTPEQIAGLEMGIEWFRDHPLVINEFAETIPQINLLVRQHKADVFIIDTVNELTSDDAQFWLKLGKLASGYKKIAKKHNCVGVMLAQLDNTDGRPTKKEMIGESKRMKNTADLMDFVYREAEAKPYNCAFDLQDVIEIYRVKGRFTGASRCFLRFDAPTGVIEGLDEDAVKSIQVTIRSLIKKK